jgi:hypothetical protein
MKTKADSENTVSSPFPADEEVQRMVDEWDTVICVLCGKKISMLDADTINFGSAFIHHRGNCKR